MTARWGISVRISDDKAGAGLGVRDQTEDCVAKAKALGGDVVEVYTDNSISAYSGKTRPGYERMVTDLRSGRINGVIAWHTDRLHRSPRELEDFIDVVESVGARVETVTAGPVDLSTTEGRMLARIACAIARRESEHKAERVARRMLSNAEAGKPHGGPRAFGYTADRTTIVPSEAATARAAAARLLDGHSLAATARWLNDQGLLSAQGRRWSATTLKGVMTAERLAGVRVHRGVRVTGTWEPIFDEITHKRLVALLTARGRYVPRVPGDSPYLLSGGLARCERCGSPMRANSQTRTHGRQYRCARREITNATTADCTGVSIMAPAVEQHVATLLLARYSTPENLAVLAQAAAPVEDGVLAIRVETDVARLREIEIERADGLLDADSFRRMAQRLQERINEGRRAVLRSRSVPLPDVDLNDLVAWWNEAGNGDRRGLLNGLIEAVWVGPRRPGGPANQVDLGRIRVAWR